MPQKRKPPRLWLRTDTGSDGKQRESWIIKDGGRNVRTGCLAHQTADAERKLAEHLAGKYQAPRGGRSSEITLGAVLTVYLEEKAQTTAAPKTTGQIIGRLNEFFGAMTVSEIRGKTCRDFAAHRQTQSGARRDLEVMRAAVRYYHKEYGLDMLPAFTLPDKSLPRDRYLTRSEAAALLWAALGWEKQGMGCDAPWIRKRDQKRSHLARLILIGLYTGTRPGAVLDLQWLRNTAGWKRLDGWTDEAVGIRPVVHYLGVAITKPNKAFRSAIAAAGLTSDVTPHVLRHTRGTWLAQAGVPSGEAAASLGLTVEEYERTYLHNDPEFQKSAANAY